MNLSNKTSDLKMYSRGKYSDGLPHTSDDIHQESDLSIRKLGLIMDSLLGSGILETPAFGIKNNGDNVDIRISKPFTVNLKGDIFLVGNSPSVYPLSIPITQTNSTIFLICWYENITANSTLYEYGGLCNNEIENDILNTKLNIQTSSKIQIRWNLAYSEGIFHYNNMELKTITFLNSFKFKDSIVPVNSVTGPSTVVGRFYGSFSGSLPWNNPIDPYYYIIPVGYIDKGTLTKISVPTNLAAVSSELPPKTDSSKVWYNPTDETVKMYINDAWRNVGGNTIIKSETEPTNVVREGTIWYNTLTSEFRTYIKDVGFVESSASIGFIQLQSTHTFTESINNASDITLTIPIDSYLPTDILRLSYEGIELFEDLNYTLNSDNKTITLLSFTVQQGDHLTFTVTRTLDARNLTTVMELLETMRASINRYVDDTTNKKYKLGVNNGLLYIKEVN